MDIVVLVYLCSFCCVAVFVLCLFLVVPCIGLWSLIVAFPGHTYLPFELSKKTINRLVQG